MLQSYEKNKKNKQEDDFFPTNEYLCSVMKHFTLILLLFAMMVSNSLEASAKRAPKSPLKSVELYVGGGMMPGVQDYIHLRKEKDSGKLLLTVRGDCFREKVSFEVPEEVFRHCEELILETKLYTSKGFYKSEFVILDAPTTDFRVSYEDDDEDFYAGGFFPSEIGLGIRAVKEYLYGLRGDRQAPGHLERIRSLNDDAFLKAKWSNGRISFQAGEDGIQELFEFLSKEEGIDYEFHNWEAWRMEGSGFNCLVVTHRRESIMEVFLDQDSKGKTIRDDEEIKGQWPQTARRPLLRRELVELPTDTLKMMAQEIKERYPEPYKNPMTDLERMNYELIDWLLQWRKQHSS